MMRFQFILSIALLYLVVVTLVLHKLIPQIVTVEERLPPTPSNQNLTISPNATFFDVEQMQILLSESQKNNSTKDDDSITVIDNNTVSSIGREQSTRRKQQSLKLNIECNKIIRRELDISSCNETNPNDCQRSYNVYLPQKVCDNGKGSREAIVGTLPLVFVVHCYRCNSRQ